MSYPASTSIPAEHMSVNTYAISSTAGCSTRGMRKSRISETTVGSPLESQALTSQAIIPKTKELSRHACPDTSRVLAKARMRVRS
ncbi:hypothetical protein DBV15_09789 [Temnothorax longispinosus]|uniref:Uncharacterized protein n=1 Tax=Temnothorax longispinosus TaxID=300112 RepID=A0A4S2JS73_9HYME|nr:hypothetical protein DBV15_09789 [Temnothorax longispinosus]